MSFSRGVLEGQQIFANFHNAFQSMKERRELDKVADAKAEQSQGFTADQGKELENLAKQGYDLTFDQEKNAYVGTNAAGDTKTVGMQSVTDFLGNRTAGELTQQQQDTARTMAMADVVGRRNPERGIQMRSQATNQAHQAAKQVREEQQWAREDKRIATLEGIDKELGQAFEAGLVGEDGQRRAPTANDYLNTSQQRAYRMMQSGYGDEAQKTLQQHYALSHVKIQSEGAERKRDLGVAMAAFEAGDYNAVGSFYNKYVPSGSKVTGIEADKNGGLVMRRTGLDGQEMEPLRVSSPREGMAMLMSLEDPRALYQYSQDEFRNQLARNQDRRAANADGRAAAADGRAALSWQQNQADRRNTRDALEGLAVEEAEASGTPLSNARRQAIRAGVIQPSAVTGKGSAKFDYDPKKVQSAFGTTEVDPLTGKETIKRNRDEESKFMQFMGDNPNIRDVNEGLIRYNQAKASREKKDASAKAAGDKAEAERYSSAVKEVRKNISMESLKATADKYNMSVSEVLSELAAKGVVPK